MPTESTEVSVGNEEFPVEAVVAALGFWGAGMSIGAAISAAAEAGNTAAVAVHEAAKASGKSREELENESNNDDEDDEDDEQGNFFIILATTTESVEESTTTIDSCDRLNRRAGAVRKGCRTTTTSRATPTIAILPNTDSRNLKLQIFVGPQLPTSPTFFSISELQSGKKPYAAYTVGESISVRQITNLAGGDREWKSGYTVRVSSSPMNNVVITSVYVDAFFYLKHLAGIRPVERNPPRRNSVIPREATVKISYIGKEEEGDNHNFKVQISSYQNWELANGIYKFEKTLTGQTVILGGTDVP